MSRARIRVLQVVSSLAAGGVETWLTHVHRHVDRTRFQIDYLVHTPGRSHYTDIVTALGGAIYECPSPRNPLRYLPSLIITLKRHGPFDVVHSHVQHFSGVVLLAARAAGVPVRIAHCHAVGLPYSRYLSLPRHLYTSLTGHWIRRHATHKLSGSHASAPALFGRDPAPDGSYLVLYNGIDLEPFRCRRRPCQRTRRMGHISHGNGCRSCRQLHPCQESRAPAAHVREPEEAGAECAAAARRGRSTLSVDACAGADAGV